MPFSQAQGAIIDGGGDTLEALDRIISSKEAIELIDTLNVYITYIDEAKYSSVEKDNIDYLALYIQAQKHKSSSQEDVSEEASVMKLSKHDVLQQINDPIIRTALRRAKSAIDAGYVVHDVNVLLPRREVNILSGCPIEQVSEPWGFQYGHNWRFYWISVPLETNLVNVQDRPSLWSQIMQASFKVLVKRVVDHVTHGTWSVLEDMDKVIASASPINYYFNTQNEFIRGFSAGNWYSREICIEDTDNKMPGFNYYPWGSAERLVHASHIFSKYKVSEDYGGIYAQESYTTPNITSTCVNYYNWSYLRYRTKQHYDFHGFWMYIEEVNIDMNPNYAIN
jgi:hypothetical protein